MIVAILGIGEAGGTLARDLIAEGVLVRGWDPDPRAIPDGLDLASSNPAAVIGVDIVWVCLPNCESTRPQAVNSNGQHSTGHSLLP